MKNYCRSVGKVPLYSSARQKFISLFHDSRGHLIDYRFSALRQIFIYLETPNCGDNSYVAAHAFDSLSSEYLFKADFISAIGRCLFEEYGVSSIELFTDGHATIFFKPVVIYPNKNI